MQQEIINQVKRVLAETLKLNTTDDININTRLKEDLGLDSMSSLTFLMGLEDSINGFIVDPETLNASDLITVEAISSYVFQATSLLRN